MSKPAGGVAIGTEMFGRPAGRDGARRGNGSDAITRRVYTQSRIDYVADAVIYVAMMREQPRGYRITLGAEDAAARHRRVRAALTLG
jgi:hypothetical protein